MAVELSFLDFLRTGELPPIRRGTTREQVLRLLGTPTSWVSRDDPLFQPPRRDYRTSNSISFGSLTFSFDQTDRIDFMMVSPPFEGECSYPPGSLYFAERTTSILAVAELMRAHGIPFEESSIKGGGMELKTEAGVVVSSANETHEIFYCGHEPRNEDVAKIDYEQLHKDCDSIADCFGSKSFEDMIAAFGLPTKDLPATATAGRILIFENVAKTIRWLRVQRLPNGKFEFYFRAARADDDKVD